MMPQAVTRRTRVKSVKSSSRQRHSVQKPSRMPRLKPTRRKKEKPVLARGASEPVITVENYKMDLINALNWYAINWSTKDYIHSAEAYLKYCAPRGKTKKYIMYAHKAPYPFMRQLGILSNLARTPNQLSPYDYNKLVVMMQEIETKSESITDEELEKHFDAPPMNEATLDAQCIDEIEEQV